MFPKRKVSATLGNIKRHPKYSFVQEGRELGGAEFRDDPGHTHARPQFPRYHHNITVLDGWWRSAAKAVV